MSDNINAKDGSGAGFYLKSKETSPGSGVQTSQHVPSDQVGVPYSNTYPQPIASYPLKTSSLTPATINIASSGDATIVVPTLGVSTKVHRMKISSLGNVTLQVKNGSSIILEIIHLAANSPFVLAFSDQPWYTGSQNTSFVINTSASVQVDGTLEYVQN